MTPPQERETVATLIAEATAAGARLERACEVLGLAARTVQRWRSGDGVQADRRPARVYVPPHKLSEAERAKVLAVANSPEFGHLPPCQIVPRLADRGEYLASESTFYRILKAENQLAHRRAERPGQARGKPRALCATAPNQVYCWDITYLPAAIRGQFFYLYLFLDLFSRKIVGWQVYGEESSALAGELLRDVCRREDLVPGQVVLHSDNGGPMKGSTMLATDCVAIFRETFWGLPGAKRSEKLATSHCLRRPAPSCVRHASILRFTTHSGMATTNDSTPFRLPYASAPPTLTPWTPPKHPALRLRGGRRASCAPSRKKTLIDAVRPTVPRSVFAVPRSAPTVTPWDWLSVP